MPLFVVDAGNFAWKSPSLSAAQVPAQRKKAELQVRAFALAGIDAVGVGEGDLSVGVEWLTDLGERHEAPLLAANLECGGKAPFPGWRRVERAGVSLGVVGVLPEKAVVPEGCRVSSPEAAVRAAVDDLGRVDALVVLSGLDAEAESGLAERVPAVDLVLSGGRSTALETPRALPGDALVFCSGSRGKNVGVATVTLVPGAQGFAAADASAEIARKLESARRRLESARTRLGEAAEPKARQRAERRLEHAADEVARLEAELEGASAVTAAPHHGVEHALVALREEVADHPATLAMVNEVMGALDSAAPKGALPYAGPYVGSAACASCHPGQDAQWKTTRHARAWQTLVDAGRQNDPACFTCHVTGAHDPVGPRSAAEARGLGDVGCENCHGPGQEHVAGPGPGQMVRDPPEDTCRQCHDGERDSGRFEWGAYRPRVAH